MHQVARVDREALGRAREQREVGLVPDEGGQSLTIHGNQKSSVREQRKVGLVPEDVTAHRLLIVAHLDVQMGGHVHQVPRTGSVSTTDDFGRTPIKGAHLQSAGAQSAGSVHAAVNVPFKGADLQSAEGQPGVSQCGSQCPIQRRSPAPSRSDGS